VWSIGLAVKGIRGTISRATILGGKFLCSMPSRELPGRRIRERREWREEGKEVRREGRGGRGGRGGRIGSFRGILAKATRISGCQDSFPVSTRISGTKMLMAKC
jgi:hypothetical protein